MLKNYERAVVHHVDSKVLKMNKKWVNVFHENIFILSFTISNNNLKAYGRTRSYFAEYMWATFIIDT